MGKRCSCTRALATYGTYASAASLALPDFAFTVPPLFFFTLYSDLAALPSDIGSSFNSADGLDPVPRKKNAMPDAKSP